MGLSANTIAASIAALTVAGVTIKGLTTLPNLVDERQQVFMPDPGNFMTDLEIVVDSYGSSAARKTIYYTLHYVYLHAPVGQERNLHQVYPGLVANVLAILDALVSNDALSGCIDQYPSAVGVGIVSDPSGIQFYGCPMALRIQEFNEV